MVSIGLIAEGVTDFVVLENILRNLYCKAKVELIQIIKMLSNSDFSEDFVSV